MHCSFFAVTIARPFGAPLEIFACSAPLSLLRRLERPSLLDFFFLFFYISFYHVFFVGTRGYVRQRRVITLNNAARRVATGFCPNGRGLRCNRKSGKRAGDAFRSIASRVRWVPLPYGVEWGEKTTGKLRRLRNRIGVRSPLSLISLSFRYSVVKVLQIYKRARVRRNVTACFISLHLAPHSRTHSLFLSLLTLFIIHLNS